MYIYLFIHVHIYTNMYIRHTSSNISYLCTLPPPMSCGKYIHMHVYVHVPIHSFIYIDENSWFHVHIYRARCYPLEIIQKSSEVSAFLNLFFFFFCYAKRLSS